MYVEYQPRAKIFQQPWSKKRTTGAINVAAPAPKKSHGRSASPTLQITGSLLVGELDFVSRVVLCFFDLCDLASFCSSDKD